MKIAGDITVEAARDDVFRRLRDARFFASCIDGVNNLKEIDPTHYTATMETKVAYIKFKFSVSVELIAIEPPHRIEAKIEGTPIGIVGRLTATSKANLVEQGNKTQITYEIDAALTGKLGSLGQPVINSKAKDMEKQFSTRLRAAFENQIAEPAP